MSFRKIWIQIHLIIGLAAGGIFVVLGLSGSVLVFHQALDEWLNPAQLRTNHGGARKSLDELVARVQASEPGRMGPAAVELPADARGVLVVYFKHPSTARMGEEAEWFEVDVDPYTGQVLGQRPYTGHLTGFIYEFHESLMLGGTGEFVVGLSGVVLVLSLLSGAYLWWPKPGSIGQAFRFQTRPSPIQRQLARPRLTRIGSLLLLVIVAVSGVCLVFRDEIPALLNTVMSAHTWPAEPESMLRPAAVPLSASQVAEIAAGRFPNSELRWMDFPVDKTDVFRVGLHSPHELTGSGYAASERLWVEQYTGEILAERDWQTFTPADKVLSAMMVLHNGQGLGMPGRMAVCLVGFTLPVLYITAIRSWLMKRRARRRPPVIAGRGAPILSPDSPSSVVAYESRGQSSGPDR